MMRRGTHVYIAKGPFVMKDGRWHGGWTQGAERSSRPGRFSLTAEEFGYGSPGALALLQALDQGKVAEIRPVIDPTTRAVAYPALAEVAGVSGGGAPGLLDFLTKEGILVREPVESYHHCQACGGTDLLYGSRCSSCGGKLLQSSDSITHLRCGHTDVARAFTTGRGLRCPRCGKALQQLGVDYRRASNYYKCLSCGKGGTGAAGAFLCRACGATTKLEDSKLELVYMYHPNPDASEMIHAHSVDLEEVKARLNAAGFSVTLNARARGKSGVFHSFALIAWSKAAASIDEPPEIVVEVRTGKKDLPDGVVSELMMKLTDTRSRLGVLAASPGVSRSARELAEFYGIKMAVCETVEEIPGRVAELLDKVGPGGQASASVVEAPVERREARVSAGRPESTAAILMTMYEKESQSYDTLKRLVEQVKDSNSRLEELLSGSSRNRMTTPE